MNEAEKGFGAHPRLRTAAVALIAASILLIAANTALHLLDTAPHDAMLLAPFALAAAGCVLWFIAFALDKLHAPKPPPADLREPPFE